jgi:hypothetical protein
MDWRTKMPRTLVAFALVLPVVMFAAPRRSAADASIQAVFSTVDAVEIRHAGCDSCTPHEEVAITGIVSGSSVPSTTVFNFGQASDIAARCERIAMLVMSKPGKYHLGIGAELGSGGRGDCKLMLVTQ